MTKSGQNRPFKFGPMDRREFITGECEVTIRAQNDGNGNAIYLGRAKAGADEDAEVWQISLQAYDANSALTSKTWPENDFGKASAEYEFSWTDRATYTYS